MVGEGKGVSEAGSELMCQFCDLSLTKDTREKIRTSQSPINLVVLEAKSAALLPVIGRSFF